MALAHQLHKRCNGLSPLLAYPFTSSPQADDWVSAANCMRADLEVGELALRSQVMIEGSRNGNLPEVCFN